MISIVLGRLVPQFLLNDRNGRALAKAMEAGMNAMMRVVDDGIGRVMDVDKMPEWRLDEMAWETNTLYDYAGTVEQKRGWIRDALPIYRYYGTPYALKRYLTDMMGNVTVQEAAEYGGEAYHFRIESDTPWTAEKERFVRLATEKVKNLRSTLDGMAFENRWESKVYIGYAMLSERENDVTMAKQGAISTDGLLVDERDNMLTDEYGIVLYAENGARDNAEIGGSGGTEGGGDTGGGSGGTEGGGDTGGGSGATYKGIPIYENDTYLNAGYQKLSELKGRSSYYFVFRVDTGTTADKKIRFGYYGMRDFDAHYMVGFLYENSAAYYYSKIHNDGTLNTVVRGRYLYFTVRKDYAERFVVQNTDTGEYYARGENAT